jgi:hypothetical protein
MQRLNALYATRDRVCNVDPGSGACANIQNQITAAEERLNLLRQQYSSCTAAHF